MANFYYENRYWALGIIGALINLVGQSQGYPQPYYIIGSIALLITAIHYSLLYFIALELILGAGHTAVMLGVSTYIQFALPVLLCFQLFIFYLMLGKENSIFLLIGIIGIALLSLGFTYNNEWIFFLGGLSISIYAYYNALCGHYPSYIWAFLNTIFALIALCKIFL
ncbi:MAG: hypothetical protein EPN84_04920 [Legionella sp.]|nr:MAG: hypothetical protein EPN84_04920 [Legionella sp.]